MTVSLVLSSNLSAAMPGVAALKASLSLNVARELAAATALLAEVQADLQVSASMAADMQASLSVDPRLSVAATLSFAADAMAAMAAGLSGPALQANLSAGLSAQIEVSASLTAKVADLQARIAELTAALELAAGFDLAPNVRVYLYTGKLAELGGEVANYIDGAPAGLDPQSTVYAPVLVTDSPQALDALGRILKVSP